MHDRITSNPAVCGGRPCIRGLRVRVTDVLDLLASDVPREEILEDFPYLEAADITACLQFAAARANHRYFKAQVEVSCRRNSEDLVTGDLSTPPALARWLDANGYEAIHVSDLGFSSAEDEDIWTHAKQQGFVIISKDEDFADLCILDSEPAQVVWLRIRNCSKRALLSWFESVLPRIEKALSGGDRLVEVV